MKIISNRKLLIKEVKYLRERGINVLPTKRGISTYATFRHARIVRQSFSNIEEEFRDADGLAIEIGGRNPPYPFLLVCENRYWLQIICSYLKYIGVYPLVVDNNILLFSEHGRVDVSESRREELREGGLHVYGKNRYFVIPLDKLKPYVQNTRELPIVRFQNVPILHGLGLIREQFDPHRLNPLRNMSVVGSTNKKVERITWHEAVAAYLHKQMKWVGETGLINFRVLSGILHHLQSHDIGYRGFRMSARECAEYSHLDFKTAAVTLKRLSEGERPILGFIGIDKVSEAHKYAFAEWVVKEGKEIIRENPEIQYYSNFFDLQSCLYLQDMYEHDDLFEKNALGFDGAYILIELEKADQNQRDVKGLANIVGFSQAHVRRTLLKLIDWGFVSQMRVGKKHMYNPVKRSQINFVRVTQRAGTMGRATQRADNHEVQRQSYRKFKIQRSLDGYEKDYSPKPVIELHSKEEEANIVSRRRG